MKCNKSYYVNDGRFNVKHRDIVQGVSQQVGRYMMIVDEVQE